LTCYFLRRLDKRCWCIMVLPVKSVELRCDNVIHWLWSWQNV